MLLAVHYLTTLSLSPRLWVHFFGKSKNGLLREITRILFLPKKQVIRKEFNRGFFSAKQRQNPKMDYDFSAKTACHMYFFESFPKETQKRRILRIRIQINPLNPRRERIHWIHNPFFWILPKKRKIPFWIQNPD